ncbi:protein spinster homolog 1-like isoform X3 [Dreissena polymorpha]|uniref:protein spinster homolog 1-like isoform X3 n=1 Tax=Dreissena polymorpha TaxID=45954 RepID=UPI002264E1B0|nr:protein spinster homolog 1-like isoform X3 [Dreissena polymorpha]
MSTYDSNLSPPFDDLVQLTDMEVAVSDEQPIVNDSGRNTMETPDVTVVSPTDDPNHISKARGYVIVLILFLINLLNYMDRFTIAGVLKDIQLFYGISNSEDGLLQTSFISFYMIFSPIFGYLGDRFVRKYIMAGGILFWALVTFGGSFVPSKHFWGFIIMRGMVGVGEASYSTIAPTIIADLFSGGMRTRALMIFYFAIPVGSGLGYIVGSNVAEAFHAWQYALRVTPILGVISVVLIMVFLKEPVRGGSDGAHGLKNTSFLTDLKAILTNKSFMLSSLGFTCVAFTTGALALWGPIFMQDASTVVGNPTKASTVALIFGGITVVAGFIGVALGAESSRRYKLINPRADPLICAFGLLICTPFLFFALVLSGTQPAVTWVLIFLGEVALCLNWAIIADILLYVVIPTRRSAAEAVQILMSHLLGDAGSPFLIGVIADASAKRYDGGNDNPAIQFVTLQESLYITTFICVLGGAFFLACALFIVQDKTAAEQATKERSLTGEDNAAYEDFVNSSSAGLNQDKR